MYYNNYYIYIYIYNIIYIFTCILKYVVYVNQFKAAYAQLVPPNVINLSHILLLLCPDGRSALKIKKPIEKVSLTSL